MKLNKELVTGLRDTIKGLHRASLYTDSQPDWNIVDGELTTCTLHQPKPPVIEVVIGQECLNELGCVKREGYTGVEYCYHVYMKADKYLKALIYEEEHVECKGWGLNRNDQAFVPFAQLVKALGGTV